MMVGLESSNREMVEAGEADTESLLSVIHTKTEQRLNQDFIISME